MPIVNLGILAHVDAGKTSLTERILFETGVLDGVVIVVSAVEGVQAQTRKMVQAVRQLGLPLILAINKIDRTGARDDALLADIRGRLDLPVLPMNRVTDLGTHDVSVAPH